MMQQRLLKQGQFYSIFEVGSNLLLEDKTKRGLEVREHIIDNISGIEYENGMIHDMDGVGHKVVIRSYFPKEKHSLETVIKIAEDIDAKYKSIREMTCPDDIT
jgi:hypothetical protein